MAGEFSDRVVVVTGGTRNIGRAIAEAFAAEGATAVVLGRNDPGDLGPLEFSACDVRDPEAVAATVDAVVERHGRLDIAVNNAGGSPFAPALEASPRFTERVIALNLLAPFYVAQAAARHMFDQADGGSIVNIGSISGMRPSPGTSAYAAAKSGLIGLTETLAMEWAPKVRVNLVTAGLVESDDADVLYGSAEATARVRATVPMGRMVTPPDVAGAVLAMSSARCAYVTGANLVLHGGGERPPYLSAIDGSLSK